MRTIFPTLFILLAAAGIFSSCQQDSSSSIIGSWQIDSIYDNYNGFGFTNKEPSPREVYEYRENKTVLRKGMGEEKQYFYSLHDSILVISENAGRTGDDFIILHVDEKMLAIKKNKKPLFAGKNQVRYEVRYFSRIGDAALKH